MSNLKTTFSDLALSESSNSLLSEVIAELDVAQRDQVKDLIRKRILEIKRMEACIEKAKADLAQLLKLDTDEILMLEG
jgi:hypothetical protein